MTSALIIGFIIGILAADGVLHFIEGAKGMKMPVFGKFQPSIVAVVWGWFLMAVSVVLWYTAPTSTYPQEAVLALLVGVLVIGIVFSMGWAKNIIHKK
jgi:hypothetical protein